MRVTTSSGPAPHLFSLKWRALIIFSLLLLGINSFSTFYFSRNLLNQFEQGRQSNYAKQVKELDGLVRQSSATLTALADIVPLMNGMQAALLSGNTREVAKAFGDHWQSLQLSAAADVAQLYDTRNELIGSWKTEDIEFPNTGLMRSHVQEVNRTERPLTFLDCANQCLEFVVAPMLTEGKNAGVIVLGATLAASIVNYKNMSGVDVGILNISDPDSIIAREGTRNVPDWHARISALTGLEQNLPMLRNVASRHESLNAAIAGLRETFGGREVEIHLIPLAKFAFPGDSYFILIDDITQSLSQVREGIRRNIMFGLVGLLLSELILLLILWRPLSRLRRTADLLPLLAQNAFEKIRKSIQRTRSTGKYQDEFDVLDETLVAVSRQLENLQAEVAQRTTELEKANKLLGSLNEELEQKVEERTRQLLETRDELVRKEKLAVLGQVAGSVGHELRNPLGVMSNAVYFLQTVLPDADDSVKEYLGIIKNEIAGSERIVSDLLDSVRIKPPHPEAVALAELIQQTLHKLTIPSIVSVRQDIPSALPPLRVDAMQISQVLRNLISNGVEAMPHGGLLRISAEANAAADTVIVRVRDDGVGMTAEQRGKLFQPLFTTKARGIGLGLVVVKNLTEANGGKVEVQSEPGKGSEFRVILPAVQEKESHE